jgi:hypothetical protein
LQLVVLDAEHGLLFKLLFATIDPSLFSLPAALRQTIVKISGRTAELSDAILDVRRTVELIKGTIAKSNGAPYIVARDGIRL